MALVLQTVSMLAIAGCGGNVSVATTGAGGSGNGGNGNGGNANGGGGTSTISGTPTNTITVSPGNEFDACNGPGQCVLAVPGCCTPCGIPEVESYVAINAAEVEAYHESVCPEETPCPLCDISPNPNLFAYCEAGKCVAADVRTHAVSACSTSDECRLRVGSECCESCDPASAYDLVAVSKTGTTLPSLVCAPGTGCDDCSPQYPPGTQPACSPEGHCQIIIID